MKVITMSLVLLVAGLTLALPWSAAARTVVRVEMWDGGDMPAGFAYGAPDIGPAEAPMHITLSSGTVPAGEVTFDVTDKSRGRAYEMAVVSLADPGKPRPAAAAEERVDEDKAGSRGEVSDLDPGASGSLTVDLQPGKYLLICNIAGHSAAGMWAAFTVTK